MNICNLKQKKTTSMERHSKDVAFFLLIPLEDIT